MPTEQNSICKDSIGWSDMPAKFQVDAWQIELKMAPELANSLSLNMSKGIWDYRNSYIDKRAIKMQVLDIPKVTAV